jgi:hypothetical protein
MEMAEDHAMPSTLLGVRRPRHHRYNDLDIGLPCRLCVVSARDLARSNVGIAAKTMLLCN